MKTKKNTIKYKLKDIEITLKKELIEELEKNDYTVERILASMIRKEIHRVENNLERRHKKLKKDLEDIRNHLENYKDTHLEKSGSRPHIVWPDGSTLGMGFAFHMTGDPGGFNKLGFGEEDNLGYTDFYELPKKIRNEFLDNGLEIFNRIFPEGIDLSKKELEKKYKKLLKELEKLANRTKNKK